MSQNELYHHGIDGQKWGIRHGPPYPLDRADHNKVVEKSEKASKKRHLSYRGSRKYAKRMSDKDLNDTIDRLQREETYRRLVSKEKADKKAAKIAKKEAKEAKVRYENQNEMQKQQFEENKKANSIVRKVITNLLTNAATVAGKEITKRVINEKLGVADTKEKDKSENKQTETIKEKTPLPSPKKEELEKQISAIEEKKKDFTYEPLSIIIDEPTKTTAPADFKVWLDMDNRKREAAKYDLKTMSESEVNQAIMDTYPYDMYLSDESEGACV